MTHAKYRLQTYASNQKMIFFGKNKRIRMYTRHESHLKSNKMAREASPANKLSGSDEKRLWLRILKSGWELIATVVRFEKHLFFSNCLKSRTPLFETKIICDVRRIRILWLKHQQFFEKACEIDEDSIWQWCELIVAQVPIIGDQSVIHWTSKNLNRNYMMILMQISSCTLAWSTVILVARETIIHHGLTTRINTSILSIHPETVLLVFKLL